MTVLQAVPTYRSRRKMMLGCGVYFPHLVPEVGDRTPPPPPQPAADERKTSEGGEP